MEERLIIAVSGFPVLYDVSLFAYRDLNKKNDAWKKVSEIVGVPVEECKKRWKNLRDTFRREKNRERERNRSGAGAVSSRPWRYMGVMSFLNPFVESRPTSGNMVVEVEEALTQNNQEETEQTQGQCQDVQGGREEGQESSDEGTAPSTSGVISGLSPTPLQKKRRQSSATVFEDKLLKILESVASQKTSHQSPPTEDPDEMFFRSILSDFKSLTERRRDELKFKIHQLIFEAKCQEAEENTKI
ncbi:hypothetical protein AMEX_G27817 [Astyanax mexicanus]|uniref:MADF domain-containing protein n=1 Tax=Astyanax mexicanus TaxID=7994 RepID=A0A8T2KP53_ASTMX|nr:hypothetical protein AMEX_G27817 [Astyanax mexicanus]